jgi:predicted HNH restriction endonuclease
MNVFNFRDELIDDYAEYIASFVNVRHKRIRDYIDERLKAGVLWPQPLIQFNPSFERGAFVKDLVREGVLYQGCADEFFTPEQLRAQASGYPTHLLQHRLDELLARIGSDPGQITVDDLKSALMAVELTEHEKGALIALWQLPECAGTAEEVATQAGFVDSIEASNCIEAIGNKLAKFFGRVKPGEEEPGYLFIAQGAWQNGVLVWYLLEDVCQAIEQLGWVEPVLAPEAKEYQEGDVSLVSLTRYERSPAAREAALKAHGYVCSACGFDFEKVYGDRGQQFIEVHHLQPLPAGAYPRHADPAHDLLPICSNCHRMIHRREPMLSIDEMRDLIKKRKQSDYRNPESV